MENKMKKSKNETFIERAIAVHGNKYDYSKTKYTKSREKVIVTCHKKDEFGYEHGDFEIRACNHLGGTGCPKCGGRFVYTIEEWKRKANKVHNNKYDYSLITDTKGKTIGRIICPIHGEFEQELASHLNGCGCQKCNKGVVDTKEGFIESANKIHGDYYNYDKFVYVNRKVAGVIVCPRHGEFTQTPDAHLRGCGCKKCKSSMLENIIIKALNKNNINFIFQFSFIASNGSTYKADFLLEEPKIIIECQGEQHFYPTKFSSKTSDEQAKMLLNERIASDKNKYKTAVENGYKVVYFFIPSYFHHNINVKDIEFYKDKEIFTDINRLIDYISINQTKKMSMDNLSSFCDDFRKRISKDIIFIDSNTFRFKNFVISFHVLKPNKRDTLNSLTREQKKLGYSTLHIFEDEYIFKREILFAKLSHIFGLNKIGKRKIYGRKCIIRNIYMFEAKEFLNKNHIQGFSASTVYLGAFCNDELVGVMTFLHNNDDSWTLTRFATDINSTCSGVGGKLFKYFVKNYEPITIKSFSDKRWVTSKEDIYTKLGFINIGNVYSDYHYIHTTSLKRIHKFNFRKQILHKKYGLPLSMTELAMTRELGYDRIWDCGLIKYVYINTDFNG